MVTPYGGQALRKFWFFSTEKMESGIPTICDFFPKKPGLLNFWAAKDPSRCVIESKTHENVF